MKTEVKLSSAVGKTLQAVEFGGWGAMQCVLAFTDDTFATLGIKRGYEVGDEELIEESLLVFDFDDDKLVRAGIVTADEMAAMRKARDETRQAIQETCDRREFERLRRKFEV